MVTGAPIACRAQSPSHAQVAITSFRHNADIAAHSTCRTQHHPADTGAYARVLAVFCQAELDGIAV